jgi:hypothetical protein
MKSSNPNSPHGVFSELDSAMKKVVMPRSRNFSKKRNNSFLGLEKFTREYKAFKESKTTSLQF